MSTSTVSSPKKKAASVPAPVIPIDGMPIDGSAAQFEWTAVPGTRSYEVQVARDAAFDDVLYTVETGPTTLLTLYELLPEDGSNFFWRVRARTHVGWQPWSAEASFRALTEQHTRAHKTSQNQQAARIETGPRASKETEVWAIEPPYRTEFTSGGSVLLFLFMMFGSFTALVLLILILAG